MYIDAGTVIIEDGIHIGVPGDAGVTSFERVQDSSGKNYYYGSGRRNYAMGFDFRGDFSYVRLPKDVVTDKGSVAEFGDDESALYRIGNFNGISNPGSISFYVNCCRPSGSLYKNLVDVSVGLELKGTYSPILYETYGSYDRSSASPTPMFASMFYNCTSVTGGIYAPSTGEGIYDDEGEPIFGCDSMFYNCKNISGAFNIPGMLPFDACVNASDEPIHYLTGMLGLPSHWDGMYALYDPSGNFINRPDINWQNILNLNSPIAITDSLYNCDVLNFVAEDPISGYTLYANIFAEANYEGHTALIWNWSVG